MRAFAGKLLVERDAPPQHAVENVGGNPAGGEAGNFRLWGGARARHGRQSLPRIVADVAKRRAENVQLAHSFAQGPRSRERSQITTRDCACANRLHAPNLGLCSQRQIRQPCARRVLLLAAACFAAGLTVGAMFGPADPYARRSARPLRAGAAAGGAARRPSGRGAARDRRRHLRGAGAHLAGMDVTTGIRLRGIDAPSCTRVATTSGSRRWPRAMRWRGILAEGRVGDLAASARTNMAGASMPTSRPAHARTCPRRCQRGYAALFRRPARELVRLDRRTASTTIGVPTATSE